MKGEQLIELERATVAAFKQKRDADFIAHFSRDYIGVANDGIKNAEDELKGMHALDLDSIDVEDAKASFPAENVGVVTYRMVVSGKRGKVAVDGSIYTSTVYIRLGDEWRVVLHTESMAPPSH